MIDTLVNRVWSNAAFQTDLSCLSTHWLQSELHLPIPEPLTEEALVRLLRSAAILACSPEPRHTEAAYRIATSAVELQIQNYPGVRATAEVVLARMGNFPGLHYLERTQDAACTVPLALAVEQQIRRQHNEVVIGGETIALTDFQVGLWGDLQSGKSVGVSAPTSAGKSFVVQAFLRHAAQNTGPFRIVYVVPSRALISQVAEDIAAWAAAVDDPAIATLTAPLGPNDLPPNRGVFVFTQERLHLSQLSHPELTFQLIIVDEAHVIADRSRGILLASALDEALRRNPAAQILFASPNIENPEVFGRAFGLKRFSTRRSETITVAQNLILVATPAPYKRDMIIRGRLPNGDRQIGVVPDVRRTTSTIQKLINTAHILGAGAPSLVYANGPDTAEKIAVGLAALRPAASTSRKLQEFADFIRDAVHPEYELANTVTHRVGFHYGRIPAPVRKAVEVAFSEGDLDYLVTTSTLLHGVNFPARNLFVCDPREGPTDPLAPVDFWNLAGRAGRLGREFQGNVYIIDYDEWGSRPLTSSRSTTVEPALSSQIIVGKDVLIDCIRTAKPAPESKDCVTVESTFTQLFIDFKSGRLATTLARIIPEDASEIITTELKAAETQISLPLSVIEHSPTISVHRQERLYLKLKEMLAVAPGNAIRAYIPEHPQSPKAYHSYSAIFKLCHTEILGYPPHDERNTRFAAIALRWMIGDTLPQIIDSGKKYAPKKKIASLIRDTLKDIEQHIRFTYVRLTTCYQAILAHILRENGRRDLAESIPPLPLYLELGACQQPVIAFISLGLSRITATKLSKKIDSPIQTQEEARTWILRQDLEALELAPILIAEIRRALGIKLQLGQ